MASEPTSGPITGLSGKVNVNSSDSTDCRRWNVRREADIKAYSSSSTSGWERTAKGVKRWSGSFELYLDQGEQDLGFDEGDLVDFIGYSAEAKTLTGAVRIASIEVGVDIEGAEFEGVTVNFTGHDDYALA